MRTGLAFFLFLASAFGQDLAAGHVGAAWPEGFGHKFAAYNFTLMGGGPGKGSLHNGFDYSDASHGGQFNLNFTGPGCTKGCTFTGFFDTWYEPQSLYNYCEVQSGLLTGDLNFGNGMTWFNVPAEYSQLFCVDGDNHWWTAGDLTVHNHPAL